ncbi:MAG TPA: aminotransferase [Oceanospirillaceae bacterium]|nr:aminotransferase [Oceanospirillaceae bacterium]
MPLTFNKPFTQQESIPETGIDAAIELMRSGRLHRYNTIGDELSAAAQLEQDYAAWQGSQYCLACTSGGYAIHIGLRAMGVQAGDAVLTNGYTLAPVPGAIVNVGATPVLVEIDDHYHLDLQDLRNKARASGAKVLVLSLMRGHIPDMTALMAVCDELGLQVLEDCAHTMGGSWQGKRSGNFGVMSAFSLQTYKHMNTGEGGLLVSNNEEMMAKAIMHSGSYMLYERHGAAPSAEVFEKVRYTSANMSGRMDNLRATLALAQMPNLAANCLRWNQRYDVLFDRLCQVPGLHLPARHADEDYVGSSIQFMAQGIATAKIPDFVAACGQRGVELKWFGEAEPKAFTSRYDSWRYLAPQHLPNTLKVLEKTLDMRVPLTFDVEDCQLLAQIIAEVSAEFVS